MNGYTPTTPLKERVNNLIVQIPQEYRNRAAAECLTSDGNPYDFERNLTSYVMRREWGFSDHPVNEAEFVDGFCDPRTPEQRNADQDAADYQNTIADVRTGFQQW